jgi:transcriptional regulator with XRE-family HTH domain
MTDTEFVGRCLLIGLGRNKDIAEAFNVSRQTVWKWMSAQSAIPHYVDAQLKLLELERK